MAFVRGMCFVRVAHSLNSQAAFDETRASMLLDVAWEAEWHRARWVLSC